MESTIDLVGTLVGGKYRVLEHLGSGAMGAVYKAHHEYMNRIVALKVLHASADGTMGRSEYLARFKREAQTLSLLKDPHAVSIYDFGVEEHMPYLVMQYVEGQNFKEVLASEAPLRPRRVYQILKQLSGALAELHRLGIIHRDLKPENIMIVERRDGSDRVMLLDFGIAKALSGSAHEMASLTGTFETLGTPKYMAPELASGSQLSPATDVYALAVIAYEALSGTLPFDADNAVDLVMKHMHEPRPAITEQYPGLGLPEELDLVLVKAMAQDSKVRQQTVAEFVSEFGQAVSRSLPEWRHVSPTTIRRKKRLHRAALAGFLLCLALAVYFIFQKG